MNLTARDEQIFWTLTHRLRLLSVRQVARTWWKTNHPASAVSRLRQLADAGLVEVENVMAHPEVQLAAPVLAWQPGDDEPDFGAVAYRLKSRWTKAPIPTPLVHATRAAVGMFGGYTGGRGPRPSEATHDLHLAQVFLSLQAGDPQLAKRWVSENELYADGRGRNERLPDALIRGRRAGEPPRIVEFGGSYSKAKLADFHRELSANSYEIW
ncbi:MAG TPA: hypothetical protein VNT79_06250 [Phycisphaerae bacterium]|nr:hypothetical protein [Phycisphaerae bacterium]